MRVVIVAAPLSARSGVYRSTVELVEAARGRGLDWRALIGVRRDAAGTPSTACDGITERPVDAHGHAVTAEVRQMATPLVEDADVVITMVPQSDLAIASWRGHRPWRHVSWVRGLPWPARGEQSRSRRILLRAAARWSLARTDAVWATTPLLRDEISSVARASVVPAGTPHAPRLHDGSDCGPLVFAGRLSPEKNPGMLVSLVRATGHRGVVHGDGPLATSLRHDAPADVTWAGWSDCRDVWTSAGIFVCPSFREAFGRSAVEAASAGLPSILSDRTGVARQLIRDPHLAERFVLPPTALDAWVAATDALITSAPLRERLSDHLSANARRLTTDASLDAALRAATGLHRRNA